MSDTDKINESDDDFCSRFLKMIDTMKKSDIEKKFGPKNDLNRIYGPGSVPPKMIPDIDPIEIPDNAMESLDPKTKKKIEKILEGIKAKRDAKPKLVHSKEKTIDIILYKLRMGYTLDVTDSKAAADVISDILIDYDRKLRESEETNTQLQKKYDEIQEQNIQLRMKYDQLHILSVRAVEINDKIGRIE